MKPLDEVLRLENDHVIIDCCPRKSSTSPIDNPAIDGLYDKGPSGFFKPTRGKYTLYASIGILLGETLDGKSLKVKCHECGKEYELTKERLLKLCKVMI